MTIARFQGPEWPARMPARCWAPMFDDPSRQVAESGIVCFRDGNDERNALSHGVARTVRSSISAFTERRSVADAKATMTTLGPVVSTP